MDSQLVDLLSTDFKLKPICLSSIASLFPGCIIKDKVTLLVISCEAYAQDESLDYEVETAVYSMPVTGSRIWMSPACCS
jgi:hypothetical protein